MTGKPKTVKDAIAYLYTSRDIANRVQSWDAGALELIETEYERVATQLAEATARARRLRAAYLDVERDAITLATVEHCTAHPHVQPDAFAATLRADYRRDLHDGDVPDV